VRLASPLFRHSYGRDAYVLRGVGNRLGPVLQVRSAQSTQEAEEQSSSQGATPPPPGDPDGPDGAAPLV
jgi:hypothetical protein